MKVMGSFKNFALPTSLLVSKCKTHKKGVVQNSVKGSNGNNEDMVPADNVSKKLVAECVSCSLNDGSVDAETRPSSVDGHVLEGNIFTCSVPHELDKTNLSQISVDNSVMSESSTCSISVHDTNVFRSKSHINTSGRCKRSLNDHLASNKPPYSSSPLLHSTSLHAKANSILNTIEDTNEGTGNGSMHYKKISYINTIENVANVCSSNATVTSSKLRGISSSTLSEQVPSTELDQINGDNNDNSSMMLVKPVLGRSSDTLQETLKTNSDHMIKGCTIKTPIMNNQRITTETETSVNTNMTKMSICNFELLDDFLSDVLGLTSTSDTELSEIQRAPVSTEEFSEEAKLQSKIYEEDGDIKAPDYVNGTYSSTKTDIAGVETLSISTENMNDNIIRNKDISEFQIMHSHQYHEKQHVSPSATAGQNNVKGGINSDFLSNCKQQERTQSNIDKASINSSSEDGSTNSCSTSSIHQVITDNALFGKRIQSESKSSSSQRRNNTDHSLLWSENEIDDITSKVSTCSV